MKNKIKHHVYRTWLVSDMYLSVILSVVQQDASAALSMSYAARS